MKATLSEPLKSLVFLLMHAIVFYYIVFDGEELNFVWIFKVRNIDLVFFRPLMKEVLVDQQQVRLGANHHSNAQIKVILNVTLGKASKTYSSQLFLKASLLPGNVCSHIHGLSSMAIWAQIYRSLENTLHFKQKIGSAM